MRVYGWGHHNSTHMCLPGANISIKPRKKCISSQFIAKKKPLGGNPMAVFAFQSSFTTKFDARVRSFGWDLHNFTHIGLPGGNIPILKIGTFLKLLKIMPRKKCISSRFQAK
mgnify:CR=1 FL=1